LYYHKHMMIKNDDDLPAWHEYYCWVLSCRFLLNYGNFFLFVKSYPLRFVSTSLKFFSQWSYFSAF
jgi:hypothetical protein